MSIPSNVSQWPPGTRTSVGAPMPGHSTEKRPSNQIAPLPKPAPHLPLPPRTSKNMVNTLPNEILHRILGFLDAPRYAEVDLDILCAMQVCRTWRILCFNILFHIDITKIRRLATWEYLTHRIRTFRETCLECQKTTPTLEPPDSTRVGEWVWEFPTWNEAQQQEKVRFVDQVKECVEMEGIEHIWAERRPGSAWEWHQVVLHCLA
ncbi:hypothetical protein LTR24_009155 [Lithohypha guttulata]|uniref:F-box domain-containing protein n=1 Tax=Lithohypha guttulata TaxID=1690604 RepID=A0ABR0JXT0_9EURO|nr:hypothetical protein LTR24_009155 [Lithohypha guttulata]